MRDLESRHRSLRESCWQILRQDARQRSTRIPIALAGRSMPPELTIKVDGKEVKVAGGSSVAAALLNAGVASFHRSVSGELRGPLCGMGTCFECRATVDGHLHARTCLILCRDGMVVETGG